MRILLTGAEGFTGRHFAHGAVSEGHEVFPLTANLTDPLAVVHEVSGIDFDAVVHLAAIANVAHTDNRALYDVNLFGTLNLLQAVKQAARPVRKILLASSANVYGNCQQSPIPETQAPAPVNHYAMSKLAMEHMSRASASGMPVLWVRPFNYTGPGQTLDFVIPKLVDHFHRRADHIRLGNLHVQREYNDVRLVCSAYLRLLEHGEAGALYNVCSGKPFGLSEVLTLLTELSGHPIEVKVDPALVRDNEVIRLCGDPARLIQATGPLPNFELAETLKWMMQEAGA